VRRLHLLDPSAMIGLFEPHPAVLTLVDQARDGLLLLGYPATAVVEANTTVGVEFEMWRLWMSEPGSIGLPFTVHTAAEVADWPGSLAVRQCVWEARATGGAVVTRDPGGYKGHQVPMLALK
jgi:hypothetical protein